MVLPAIWSVLPHTYAMAWILCHVARAARDRLPLFKGCRRSHAPLADPAPAWYAWPQEIQHAIVARPDAASGCRDDAPCGTVPHARPASVTLGCWGVATTLVPIPAGYLRDRHATTCRTTNRTAVRRSGQEGGDGLLYRCRGALRRAYWPCPSTGR